MKFSVVTSFYNTGKYVNILYESLLKQTYQKWEWIVTDDFSEEDKSKDLLLEISKKDDRVKYIEQKFKQEIYWNPHKYSDIESDFVLHLGSDDILYPKILEVYKHFFMKYNNISMIISGGRRLNEENSFINFLYCNVNDLYNFSYKDKKGEDFENMFVNKCWKHIPYPTLNFNPNNIYKKRLEDFNILTRLEEIGKVLCLNRNLSDITIRSKSLSNDQSNSHENNKIVQETSDNINKDIENRRKGKVLDTMIKLNYDEYMITNCFYFLDLPLSDKFEIVNILNKDFNIKHKTVIKELFFDHDIRFDNYSKKTNINYYIIRNSDDLKYVENNIEDLLKWKNIIFVDTYRKTDIKELIKKYHSVFWYDYLDYQWIKTLN